MLEVWDDHRPHEFITSALHFLDTHMPRHLLLPALEHLKRNKLTGKKLADLIYGEMQGDLVQFQLYLVRALHKDKKLALIAGRSFV